MRNWARPGFTTALQRLDLLLHRQILRLRASYQLSLDEFRGLYISDQQVDELVAQQAGSGQTEVNQVSLAAAELTPSARLALAGDERWAHVCRVYALTEFEQDVLLLAFAPELHSKYPVIFAYLNNDVTRKYPTIDLALNLFSFRQGADQRHAFAYDSNLSRQGLLVAAPQQTDNYSLLRGFIVAPVVREFLLGNRAMDQHLASSCQLAAPSFVAWESWPFSRTALAQFQVFADVLQREGSPPCFVIETTDGSGADELVKNSLAGVSFGCCRINVMHLLSDRNDVAERIRSICQIALLENAGVVIEGAAEALDTGATTKSVLSLLMQALRDAGVASFLFVRPNMQWRELLGSQQYLIMQTHAPDVAERRSYWHFHLAAAGVLASEQDVAAVADHFQLNFRQVRAAANDLAFRHTVSRGKPLSHEQLFAAARRQSQGDMGDLAENVSRRYQMNDLVLPEAVLARIKEVIAAIKHRRLVFEQWDLQRRVGGSTGIVSLFAGASGTGKTMTASVIANEIGLDLYRIELSGVVSKYIGETEKNLDRIFAAARMANCILFFDEADALFGKRSEVKDAHDRYANIEVAYLLQKIENHDGIVILTTNLAKSIDQAFTRRMQFIIEFPRPDVALRERLWQGMFGESVPLAEDVDINFLARQLENTGGDIKNMVLDAALMAAASDKKIIDMAMLVRAAARQMMKQGKMPSAVEFKHYFSLVDSRGA